MVAAHAADTVTTRRHVAAIGRHRRYAAGAHPAKRPMATRPAPGAVTVRPAADNHAAGDAYAARNGRPCRGHLPRMNG